jgi:hypothetical protein
MLVTQVHKKEALTRALASPPLDLILSETPLPPNGRHRFCCRIARPLPYRGRHSHQPTAAVLSANLLSVRHRTHPATKRDAFDNAEGENDGKA